VPELASSPRGRAGYKDCVGKRVLGMSVSGKQAFRHEAMFYAGEDGFLTGIVPFVRGAVEAGEPILVAVDSAKIAAIKGELNGESEAVHFADMEQVGRNPACIIPAWRDFLAEHAPDGRPVRGVGEPIWAGRSEAELVECHQHESLLNLAFGDRPSFWLVCPYDETGLDDHVLEEARHTHPLLVEDGTARASGVYMAPGTGPGPFDGELPEPWADPAELRFDRDRLREVRRFLAGHAKDSGLPEARQADVVLAVSEIATNSVLHGGGEGTVRVWREETAFVCEVEDAGRFDEPLLGRHRPYADQGSGRGLWIVNHLCDLVQMRSFPSGSVIRLHMSLI
jgi:anti-sigma regulatory factor (Ser/Thr protein kinase)